MAVASKIILLLCAWIPLKIHSQDVDPQCTIYVRDSELLDYDTFPTDRHLLGQRSKNTSINHTNSRNNINANENRTQLRTRHQHGRVAIATGAEGIWVVWQEGAYVFLRVFSHACRSRSATIKVVKDFDFEKAGTASDLGTGLGDAAALSGGRVAVAWSIDGDIWAKVLDSRNSSAAPIRANAGERHQRREIAVTASPDDDAFIVAWSTWGKDGDAWGIFARLFTADGTPVGSEQQLNVDGAGSQQQPQLFACKTGKNGPAIWASWHNGAIGNSSEFSVRRLGARSWNLGPELKLVAPSPVSSIALMCATGSATQNPTVIWAAGEHGQDKTLSWKSLVEAEGRQLLSSTVGVALEGGARQREFLEQSRRNNSKAKEDAKGASALTNKLDMVGATNSKRRRKAAMITSTLLRAEGEVLAAAVNDDQGGLTVRLFDTAPVAAYPIHQITLGGAKLERLAYDVTMDQALIMCFSHRNSITCERRHLQSLMEPEFEQVSWWFVVIIFFVLFWFRNECFDDGSRSATAWATAPSRRDNRKSASMLRRLHFEHALSEDVASIAAFRMRNNPHM